MLGTELQLYLIRLKKKYSLVHRTVGYEATTGEEMTFPVSFQGEILSHKPQNTGTLGKLTLSAMLCQGATKGIGYAIELTVWVLPSAW